MTTEKPTTFVRPNYRLCNGAIKLECRGVKFLSYSTGIMQYLRISEDGQYVLRGRDGDCYTVASINDGAYLNEKGRIKRFRTAQTAMSAILKRDGK